MFKSIACSVIIITVHIQTGTMYVAMVRQVSIKVTLELMGTSAQKKQPNPGQCRGND